LPSRSTVRGIDRFRSLTAEIEAGAGQSIHGRREQSRTALVLNSATTSSVAV
jgi:hypothetical protein